MESGQAASVSQCAFSTFGPFSNFVNDGYYVHFFDVEMEALNMVSGKAEA